MLKVVKNNNINKFPIIEMPPLFAFGGYNPCIQIDRIKKLTQSYWFGNNGTQIPVVIVELTDGTKLSIDYVSEEEANSAIKEFRKECIIYD